MKNDFNPKWRNPNPRQAFNYHRGENYHLWSRLRRQFNFFNRWWQIRVAAGHSTVLIDGVHGKKL